MTLKLVIVGKPQFLRLLTESPEAVKRAVQNTVVEVAGNVAEQATKYAPKRTGYLKSSITAKMLNTYTAEVEAEASYAAYVEYGTRYMRAQPYMRPALIEASTQIRNVFNKKFLEAIYGW